MQAILSDIRALAGVTGVAVLAKRDGHVDHLFPAAFTEKHTERLLDLITRSYQRLRGFSRLTLRFDRVIVHLFNQPEYLLLVTSLLDTDLDRFEAVVRSKFARIGQKLSARDAVAAPRGTRTVGGTQVQGDPIGILIRALNSVTDRLHASRGRVLVVADWRRARDDVVRTYVELAALAVDTAGHLTIRKGRHLDPTATNIEAFARLAERFFMQIGTARPVAEELFYSFLEPHRSTLEPFGFYLFLGSAERRPVR